jgi:hypothetical protein
MSNWTNGPWSVHNTADVFTALGAINSEGTSAPSNDGWHIADCDMGGLCLDEVRANAHLIAAAPDLYEALESLLDDLKMTPEINLDGWGIETNQARAALAKARGEV